MNTFSFRTIYLSTISIFFGLVISSCSDNNTTANNKGQQAAKLEKKGCLSNKFKSYEEMLTLDDIASIHQIDKNKVKVNSSGGLDVYGSTYYNWESNRPAIPHPSNPAFVLPDNNSIGITNLNQYENFSTMDEIVSNFEFAYKELSDEDLKYINENVEKEMAGKSKEDKKNAESLMNARKEQGYNKVEGLGNSAYWRFHNKNGGNLVVLHHDESFKIDIKISDNPEENLNIAKALANKILLKCD